MPSVFILHRSFVISFFQYVLWQCRELAGSSLLVGPGKSDLQQLHSLPWQVLGAGSPWLCVCGAAFLLTSVMGSVFSWMSLNQVDMLWSWNQTYKFFFWAEAHPKNVCGLVCAFPLYLDPRKWVVKCKNLVLLIILFLKSNSCFFPPSLSGEKRKIFCCSEDDLFCASAVHELCLNQ